MSIKAVFSRILYPLILFGSIIMASGLYTSETSAGLLTAAVLLAAIVFIVATERIIPYSLNWRAGKRQIFIDLFHSIFSAFGTALLTRVSILALVTEAGVFISQKYSTGPLWPQHWPVFLQLVLALVIGDLGAYISHRLMHRYKSMWRLHVLHHSTVRMHFLAAGRTHPFNAVLNVLLETGPVIFFGITPEALMLFSVYKGVNGLLQHANADLRPGWLSYIVATNEAHWWHHAEQHEISNNNFGNTTMLWDHVFRTFYLPKKIRPTVKVGIDNALIPENLWVHMLLPFRLAKHEKKPFVSN